MVRRILFFFLTFVFAFSTLYRVTPSWTDGTDPLQGQEQIAPYGIGDNEDIDARNRYEWERLHDPATGRIPDGIRAKELAFAASLPTHDAASWSKQNGSGRQSILSSWQQQPVQDFGGRTRALAMDVTNENILLAGAVSGGMWRSEDGGASWMKTTGSDQIHSATCISQDTRPGKRQTWYYGTGEFRGGSGAGPVSGNDPGDGVFKSTDAGRSWFILSSTASGTPQTITSAFQAQYSIATDPSSSTEDVVYVAGIGQIMRSSDGGTSWKSVLGTANGSTYTDVAITSKGALYAALSQSSLAGGSASARGIYRSTDGLVWKNITPTGFPASYSRIVLDVAPSNEDVMYLLAYTPGSGTNSHQIWKYRYVSGDGSGAGGVWDNRSAQVPVDNVNKTYWGNTFNSQSAYDLVLKIKPDDENMVVIGGTNLFCSTDGFGTQQSTRRIGGYTVTKPDPDRKPMTIPYLYPNHHPDLHAVVFSRANPSVMLTGCDGGVFRTDDVLASQVEWRSLNQGYNTIQFYTAAISPRTGDFRILGGTQDNGTFLWKGGSSPMIPFIGSDGSFCALCNDPSITYVSSQGGSIYRCTVDAAQNITQAQYVRPDTSGNSYMFIHPFAIDPNNDNVMYLPGGSRLWRNSDLSQIPPFVKADSPKASMVNWKQYLNVRSLLGSAPRISAIAASTQPANVLYFGTSVGAVYRLDDAANLDATPVLITGTEFPKNSYVGCIAIDPEDADHAVVVYSNYSVKSVFATTNKGVTWQHVSGNLEQNPDGTGNGPSCRWAEIMHTGGQTIYLLGTSTGLYSTTRLDGTSTIWLQEGISSIGTVNVDMIKGRSSDGFIAVGTHGVGMFTTNAVTSVERPTTSANACAIGQIYPNPSIAGSGATIEFTLAASQTARLRMFDIRGRLVAVLADKAFASGRHSIRFNAANLPPGIYLCVLETGAQRLAKSMMIAG